LVWEQAKKETWRQNKKLLKYQEQTSKQKHKLQLLLMDIDKIVSERDVLNQSLLVQREAVNKQAESLLKVRQEGNNLRQQNSIQYQALAQSSDLVEQLTVQASKLSEKVEFQHKFITEQNTLITARLKILVKQTEQIDSQNYKISEQQESLDNIHVILTKQQNVIIIVSVAAALIMLLAVMLWLNNRQKKHTNHLLLKQQRNLVKSSQALEEAKRSAVQANQAKSIFLANMSHELRTPLNAILGFSEILAGDPKLSQEQKKKTKVIISSGNHLLSLINDVLDISKIEAGKYELQLEIVDLQRLMQDIGAMFELRSENTSLNFELELDLSLAVLVETDSGKLRQILINLLGNAMKYTSRGVFSLRAKTQLWDNNSENVTLCVEVEDTGTGIKQGELEHMFEPFIQSKQRPTEIMGTGLGLAISKSFIEMMNGSLEVISTVNKGTLFLIKIPVLVVESAELVGLYKNTKEKEILKMEPTKLRILVVEDSIENRLLLSNVLKHVSIEIKEAENGEQGVCIFEQWHPDFIWMDMRMPVMNGYEATRRIRSLPGGDDVIIYAVTANAFNDEQEQILAAGCNGIVQKPYKVSEIFDTMEQQLGIRYQE